MSWFTLSNGEKIYYKDTKKGNEVLVMLHGICSSHKVYIKPVRLLKKNARCITIDQRGHKKSKGANKDVVDIKVLCHDLHEILEGLSLDQVTLIGWSMGAAVIMEYLKQYGTERLKQIVICDMSPKQMNDDEWKLGLFQGNFTADYIALNEEKPFFDNFREFSKDVVPILKKLPETLINPGLKIFLKGFDHKALYNLTYSMKDMDYRDCFKNLTIPLTYLYADPGSLYSPELAAWYAKNCSSKVKTARFKKATHMFIHRQPVKFARVISKVL